MTAPKKMHDAEDLVEVRTLVPRSELRITQQVRQLTQHNCEPVAGIPAPTFLRTLLPEYRAAGGDVLEIGKLRAVDADAFLRWLRTRGAEQANDTAEGESTDDTYAASLGLVGGRR